MKTLFWSVITIILLLTIVSLVLYSGEEEEVIEPLPEDVSNMISDLRAAADEMEMNYNKMNEIAALAQTAEKTQNSRYWFVEAENIQSAIMNIYNAKVIPLNRQLINSNPLESAQKQINEFMERAQDFASNDSRRDMLVARNSIGLDVSSGEWLALAEKYKNITDSYERNIGLKALGETVEKFDRTMADQIYGMINSPFVKAIYEAGSSFAASVGSLVGPLKDPFLIMQVLITYGKKNLNDEVIMALTGLLEKVDDDNEKAYFASRILLQLPNIPDAERTPFFSAVGKADDLLMAETKLRLIENGGAAGSTREEYLNDIEAVIDDIPQNYPRELIRARLIKLQKDKAPDVIINLLKDIESITLREEVLTYIALNKKACSDSDFDLLIEAMHDPYSKLTAKLDRFRKSSMSYEEAANYLTPLENYAEEIKEARPLIDLTVAWGTIDPFQSRQSLNRFDTRNKVDAAAALAGILNDKSTVSTILNDMYTELTSSKQFEPIEKSQLLRKIAKPMMNFNPQKGMKLLEEAYSLVTGKY